MTRSHRARSVGAKATALACALAAFIVPDPASATAPLQLHCTTTPTAPQTLTVPSTVSVSANGAARVVVELIETGHAVDIVAAEPVRKLRIPVPPRLRQAALAAPADFTFQLHPAATTSAAVTTVTVDAFVHCDAPQAAAVEAWYAQAEQAAAGLDGWVGGALPAGIDAALTELQRAADSPRTRALAQHLQAQALLVSGRASDAADRFMSVAEAWAALGDNPRADAARVAAAEDYNRAARYADTLALTASASVNDAAGYYTTRLVNARCLALRYGGRLDEASACYRGTTARLAALREDVELAVTTIDFGTIELQRGRVDEARLLFDRSLALLDGDGLDDERGRARFFLAEADARAGRVADALAHLDAAAFHFERSGSMRWSASTLLRLSALLADLGAVVDARAAVDAALAILAAQQAPARLAAAHLARSRIALQDHDPAAALVDATQARTIYLDLGMPVEAELAAALLARIRVMTGEVAAARALADTLKQLDATERALLSAEIALAEDRPIDAARTVAAIAPAGLAVPQRVRWERIDARLAAHRDGAAAGQRRTREHADRWRRIAQGIGNLALRDRLLWLAHGIEAEALDDLARAAAGKPGETAALGDDLDSLGLAIEIADIDAAAPNGAAMSTLSATLLPAVTTLEARDTRASRELLERLAAPRASTAAPLRRLRAADVSALAVAQGRDVLVLQDGHRHVIARRFRSDAQVLTRIIERRALSTAVDTLNGVLAQPGVPIAEIAARAAAVAALLPEGDGDRVQQGLQVISGRAWSDIPWPVLHAWQGDRAVDPPITVLRLADTARPAAHAPRSVAVHVAAQLAGRGLPALDAASSEAALIRETMPTVAVTTLAPTTRAALLDAFAAVGSWVHVAAHGKAAGGQLGGGGIWLDPVRAADPPGLLSAFDVLERRSAASLVVLNACDLGREGHRRVQAGSFADALLTTGSSQVVAALWPVSDGAARIWVSAFYRRINETPAAVDAATAAARAALRASRAYRHPHYWAGLAHFAATDARGTAGGD